MALDPVVIQPLLPPHRSSLHGEKWPSVSTINDGNVGIDVFFGDVGDRGVFDAEGVIVGVTAGCGDLSLYVATVATRLCHRHVVDTARTDRSLDGQIERSPVLLTARLEYTAIDSCHRYRWSWTLS